MEPKQKYTIKNNDTIKENGYRRLNAPERKYSFKYSEMKPVLIKRASFKDKLRRKKDQYKLVPRGIGMSGTDPVGKFIVEGIALSPIAKVVKPIRKVFKSVTSKTTPSYTKTLTGIDGNKYTVVSTVSQDGLDQYIADGRVYSPKTFSVPSIIQQNVERELSWAPKYIQEKLLTLIKENKPLDLSTIPLRDKRKVLQAYNRGKRAYKVIKDPRVSQYKNIQGMPKTEIESYNYSPIAEGVQGVHTPSGSYVNDVYSINAKNVAIHEGEHGYQQLLPYSSKQKKILNSVYKTPKNTKYSDSKLLEEKGAVNAEIRGQLADNLNSESYTDFVNKLTNLSKKQTVDFFKKINSNAYMEDYINGLSETKLSEWVPNFKLSQISVPATFGFGYFIGNKKGQLPQSN